MNTLLIGNGYWGNVVKSKLLELTNLVYVANSKDDIDYILKNFEIDFVFVCTPTSTHYNIVKKCIEYKKNVFCEKPFTGDLVMAKKLYELSEKNRTKIFVDNVFLYRDEFFILNKKTFKKSTFLWNKYEDILKENLFYTLLYHDLYLLLTITNDNWSVTDCDISDDKLYLSLKNKNMCSEFLYDRKHKGKKEKQIILDDKIFDFSTPKNDPLTEIIIDIKTNNINYESNKDITLKTIKILNKIKNECLLHTSRNIN